MANRDSKGRFTKGNRAAAARTSRRTESAYLQATVTKVPVTQWQEVVAKALDDALAGDMHARRWLSDYIIGRPAKPPVIAGIDTNLLESVIEALRTAQYDPEQVMLSILYLVTKREEIRWNERHVDVN